MSAIKQSAKAIKRIIMFFVYGIKTSDSIALKLNRELIIIPFFENLYTKRFCKLYLKKDGEKAYFDFMGARFPDISKTKDMRELAAIFEDVLLVPCFFDDSYDRKTVEKIDLYTKEGPYGYKDGTFDVRVKAGDVVIDAGAWIGDFSAYCSSKGATTYAFEPTKQMYDWLQQTKELNEEAGGGKINTIAAALGDRTGEMDIFIETRSSGANSISMDRGEIKETIAVVKLDDFVKENNIEKVDFIKADIEGAERDLLRGATEVLKTFAPKIAICTYHLPDDPEVLEEIIKTANPAYTVIQMRHKLFAAVVK
ncbi:MAG: FkbM family methyltransferase [Bacteroidales bacterium]|jgi:FkbM family methyltransferase|nr:FkbM family methyltransferase [Bacteroidales bacterium]